jgi:RNA polymerase sigma-54 factor
MALSVKLAVRQGQTMVLTPQLLQAIKLLQMPNAELAAFVEEELERNPLLERAEEQTFNPIDEPAEVFGATSVEPVVDVWATESLLSDPQALVPQSGAEIENTFETGEPHNSRASPPGDDGQGLRLSSWSGSGGGDKEASDLEAYVAAEISLNEFLTRQAMIAIEDPAERMIAIALIDALDESGYITTPLEDLSLQLGVAVTIVEGVLGRLHGLEPTGVFARNLAECLTLQLMERDRFDPAMRAMIENLTAVARRDMATLRRVCGVDDQDIFDMIAEIKRLDPKPGRSFGGGVEPVVIPDVFVSAVQDGSWRVELNSEALPRVLVNETYASHVKRGSLREVDKQYVSSQLQSANWLTKSLEQRARTILLVATEIVRRQDAFLIEGVASLRPLNLKAVADAIGVHESTVSRATSNKFIQTPRGLFEMKYFFTTSIASVGSGEAHSAESVRHRIRQMIDAEDPNDVLSDDVIVARLREANIVVARRTVAKYRDNLKIPSSVDRRRLKLGTQRAAAFQESRATA